MKAMKSLMARSKLIKVILADTGKANVVVELAVKPPYLSL